MQEAPSFNRNAVCISCDKSVSLAKKISTSFHSKNEYFAVFNFPEVKYQSSESVKFEDDGYISQIIGSQNSVYINNAIAKIKPEKIILAGLDLNQKSFFEKLLPKKRLIIIDNNDDLDKYLLSKIYLSYVPNEESGHLIIAEDSRDVSVLLAENLSVATNSKLILVKNTPDRVLESITNYIDEWKGERSKYFSYLKIQNIVNERVEGVDFSKYKSVTFFTNGVPYGLVLGNPIPFCYVNKKLRPDLFIVNNIIYNKKNFGVAISFSIDQFLNDEPRIISKIVSENNIYPIELFSSRATSFNIGHFSSYLPYDFLHISSHGGKINGYYVTEKFKDRKGVTHKVEYYETISFSNSPFKNNDDLIRLSNKCIFYKFDGLRWMSEDLKNKNIPNYVFEDMRKNIFNKDEDKRNLTRKRVSDNILHSCSIYTNDGYHQGEFQVLSAHNSPNIFNNSCWSWGTIASSFLSGGAKSYIGTLWDIESKIATDASILFYKNIFENNMSIIEAVWAANNTIIKENQKNIFFVWALPFSKLCNENKKSDFLNFINEVEQNLYKWIEKSVTTTDSDLAGNYEEIIRFIIWAINNEFNQDLIKILSEDIKNTYDYDLKKF